MSDYVKVFDKPYEEWENQPSEETPITAEVLEEYDATFEHIEDYLYETEFATNVYFDETETLSTSSDTVYVFEDEAITTSSVIDVYTSIFGVEYKSITVSTGYCSVTFPQQESALSMTCRIYLK